MTPKKIPTYSILVFGKVQGVFYRASTKEKAKSLGLHGFVRNEPDGSVYIIVQGHKKNIEALVEWCRSGPSRAMVKDIIVNKIVWEHQYENFTIDR